MTINDKAKLNDGHEMPWFGFGVYKIEDGKKAEQSVLWALEAGYRLVDTASFYQNEAGVGKGVKASGLAREDVFITSKVWNGDQGYKSTLTACEDSLRRLDSDYLDLYLIHWPGQDADLRKKTWEALMELRRQEKVKTIGVSNFQPHHLQEIIDTFGETPAVDQVECHPFYPQTELKAFAKQNNIVITAWGPLFHGHLGEAPQVNKIGEKYGKTGAQAVLRWHLQNETAIIPKSVNHQRIIENASIFDFNLSEDDMRAIDALNSGQSYGGNPDNMTFGFK
ncbi:MAG: aldo/keto reductase [Eubacteriales bacterium]